MLHWGQNLPYSIAWQKGGQAHRHIFACSFNLAGSLDECKQSLAKISMERRNLLIGHVDTPGLPVKDSSMTFSLPPCVGELWSPGCACRDSPTLGMQMGLTRASCGVTASQAPHQLPPLCAVAESPRAYQCSLKSSHSYGNCQQATIHIHREGKTLHSKAARETFVCPLRIKY